MDRLKKFNRLCDHSWYGKQFKKLGKKHVAFCIEFIIKNNGFDRDSFEIAVNRIFLDHVAAETKAEKNRRMICQELLSVCNK
jgi:hypothetical protein